jgi:rod shape-determining protein MreC
VEWDGKDPRYLQLRRIPKTVKVVLGDTVLTSSVSFNFPPGFLVGTITNIKLDHTSGMYLLTVRTGANFYNLQQVHVIENIDYDEQTRLNTETKRKIEEVKKNPR